MWHAMFAEQIPVALTSRLGQIERLLGATR